MPTHRPVLVALFAIASTAVGTASHCPRVVAGGSPVAGGVVSGVVRLAGHPTTATVSLRQVDRRDVEGGYEQRAGPGPAAAPTVATARTTADGRFEFGGLPSARFVVLAAGVDGALGSALVDHEVAGVHSDLSIELLRGRHRLTGTVRRDDRAPAGRARVTIGLGPEGIDEPTPSLVVETGASETDAEGRFAFEGLRAGAYRVEATDGNGSVSRSVSVPQAEAVRLSIPERSPSSTVRVLDRATGTPIVGAEVLISERGVRTSAASDREGRVEVPSWAAIRTVSAAGFARARPASLSGAAVPEVIALDRACTVRGSATRSKDGKPVAGLIVGATVARREAASGVTDAEGRYQLVGLPPGEISIRCVGAEGVAHGMSDVTASDDWNWHDPLALVVAAGDTATLDLAIEPAAALGCRVVDADGRPAAGAWVGAACPMRPAGLDVPPKAPERWEQVEAATDAAGTCVLDALIPGRVYELWAIRGSERALAYASAPAGGARSLVELRFPPAVVFEVQAIDAATGRGLDGVELTANPNVADWHLEEWRGRTGEEGRVRVGPIRRSASIRLSFADDSDESQVVEVARSAFEAAAPVRLVVHARKPPPLPTPDELAAEVEGRRRLRAEQAAREAASKRMLGEPLRVRVVDPEGALVASARLRWRQGSGGWVEVRDGHAVVPRPEGRAAATSVAIADALASDGRPLSVVPFVSESLGSNVDDLELRLVSGRAATGRVVDEHGNGVRGLRVDLRPPQEWMGWRGSSREGPSLAREARTDAEGRFRIGGVVPGPYVLTIRPSPAFADAKPRVVDAPFDGLALRLGASPAVVVRVTRADGEPAAGSWVTATAGSAERSPPGAEAMARAHAAVADAEGVAVLRGLEPSAPYRLAAIAPDAADDDDADGESRRVIERWSPHDTTVVLRRGSPPPK